MYEEDEDGTPREIDPLGSVRGFVFGIVAGVLFWFTLIGLVRYVW